MERGDLLVRVGAAVFAIGVVATVVAIAPVLLGSSKEPPLGLDLLMVAAPAGFGLALLGLFLGARSRPHPGGRSGSNGSG